LNTKESFYSLDPENVLLAAEEIGLLPNGEFTQLNSYENRVFDVKLEEPINDNSDNKNVIVKFYRPQRWSKEAISEEHEFLFDLKKEGVPAVAPLMFENNQTILEWNGLYASFFPKIMARMPQEFFKGDLKKIGRDKLNQILAHRKDQYGNPIYIPDEAVVFDFKRRFVSYKRPLMPFEDIEKLKTILKENDGHYILTGKVHQGDHEMRKKLNEVLGRIEFDADLRDRVHYIQDYDEELGFALAAGSDIAINVPIVGLEACGTSFMKDIANLKVLVSTADGGVADLSPPPCLEVSGANYDSEVNSLYEQMSRAGRIIKNDNWRKTQIERQLNGYIPVISGARMMKDYLKLIFGN
jgi:hypothetical protein